MRYKSGAPDNGDPISTHPTHSTMKQHVGRAARTPKNRKSKDILISFVGAK